MTPSDSLADKVHMELVRSLYANPLPSKIMLGITALHVALISADRADPVAWLLGGCALATCVLRIAITLVLRDRAMTAALDTVQARRLESAFAWPYYLFAASLGLLGGYVFATFGDRAQMLTICVLVGYCAGAATGTALRPPIAIPSIAMAIAPAIVASALRLDAYHLAASGIATAFLVGGSHSVLALHRAASTEIARRMTSVSLARHDGLTALPNRLALREYFDEHASLLGPSSIIAVHYLDLDGFKPVNDRFGHAAGDELLAAVASRLRGAVRSGDIVARLGGDEFGVVQFGLNRSEEAELLARRITAAIAQPFELGGDAVAITASVGTVLSSEAAADLEALLRAADARLYEAKRGRAQPPAPYWTSAS